MRKRIEALIPSMPNRVIVRASGSGAAPYPKGLDWHQ